MWTSVLKLALPPQGTALMPGWSTKSLSSTQLRTKGRKNKKRKKERNKETKEGRKKGREKEDKIK